MTLSAKWTAVSFFAMTALAAGSFAFAGCTVTSGTPSNIEGGTGTPTGDSGTAETSTGDSSTPATCEGNKQASGDFKSAACQAALNVDCCTELKGCFNLVIDADAGGATDNCDTYVKCVDLAQKQPTQADKEAAQKECDLGAPKSVQDAYDAIVACATNHPATNTACQ
jgi:hypothetical protein